MSHYEAQSLVNKGWRWDNNGAPAFYSAGNTKLYVSYNPNAQSGSHNYTTSSYEQNSLLQNGWKYGSVSFYVSKAGPAPTTEMRPMSGNYWQLSSELGSYPVLSKYNNLSIEVSISKNRTYLKSNNSVIYTFYSSAGVSNTTPQGNYATQVETASHFYNAGEGMGATLHQKLVNLVNLLHRTDALDYQFLIVIGYTLKHFLEPFLLVLQ